MTGTGETWPHPLEPRRPGSAPCTEGDSSLETEGSPGKQEQPLEISVPGEAQLHLTAAAIPVWDEQLLLLGLGLIPASWAAPVIH